MNRRLWCWSFLFALTGSALAQSPAGKTAAYFPERFDWQRRMPAQVGMDAVALEEALRFVQTKDNPAPRNQAISWAKSFGSNEP
jgi:hypothetical protein